MTSFSKLVLGLALVTLTGTTANAATRLDALNEARSTGELVQRLRNCKLPEAEMPGLTKWYMAHMRFGHAIADLKNLSQTSHQPLTPDQQAKLSAVLTDVEYQAEFQRGVNLETTAPTRSLAECQRLKDRVTKTQELTEASAKLLDSATDLMEKEFEQARVQKH